MHVNKRRNCDPIGEVTDARREKERERPGCARDDTARGFVAEARVMRICAQESWVIRELRIDGNYGAIMMFACGENEIDRRQK